MIRLYSCQLIIQPLLRWLFTCNVPSNKQNGAKDALNIWWQNMQEGVRHGRNRADWSNLVQRRQLAVVGTWLCTLGSGFGALCMTVREWIGWDQMRLLLFLFLMLIFFHTHPPFFCIREVALYIWFWCITHDIYRVNVTSRKWMWVNAPFLCLFLVLPP